jgi:hypothetical protein
MLIPASETRRGATYLVSTRGHHLTFTDYFIIADIALVAFMAPIWRSLLDIYGHG